MGRGMYLRTTKVKRPDGRVDEYIRRVVSCWNRRKRSVTNGTKIRISIVTLKGSSSRAQGAALGTDADYEMSPVRAAQAVSPLGGLFSTNYA